MSINMALAGELISEQTQDTTPATTDLLLFEKADNSDFLYSTLQQAITAVIGASYDTSAELDALFAAEVSASLFNAQTILHATTNDTPAALTVTEQTVVGRATGGNIAALSIDSDISSVSANDDTVPSAKAAKAANDLLVTAVLDCASGDCDDLIDAPTAFTDGDTSPDVSAGAVFITANSGATTIDTFDTELTNGKMIFVIVNDANTTFDFTSSTLEGVANDYTASNGELLIFVYTTVDSKWHYCGFPKTINNVTFAGFTASRPVYSDASGYLASGDNGGHLEITGGDYEIKDDKVDSEHYVAESIDQEHFDRSRTFRFHSRN
jgi:hypothetical protein